MVAGMGDNKLNCGLRLNTIYTGLPPPPSAQPPSRSDVSTPLVTLHGCLIYEACLLQTPACLVYGLSPYLPALRALLILINIKSEYN